MVARGNVCACCDEHSMSVREEILVSQPDSNMNIHEIVKMAALVSITGALCRQHMEQEIIKIWSYSVNQ